MGLFSGQVDGYGYFGSLTLRGTSGTLMLGSYVIVAECLAWTITRPEDQWLLLATLKRVNRSQIHYKGIHFAAPRPGGFWWWGLESLEVGATHLLARLGPPEQ